MNNLVDISRFAGVTSDSRAVVSGGLFVAVEGDDPDFAERFAGYCSAAGIPSEKLTPAEARVWSVSAPAAVSVFEKAPAAATSSKWRVQPPPQPPQRLC